MTPRLLPWRDDQIQPSEPTQLTISVNGVAVTGLVGQSLAGIILAAGAVGFRRTSHHDRPRGVFCGIGVCYDCLVEVNGLRDVRACQRRAVDGDVVVTQRDPLPISAGPQPIPAEPLP